MCCKLKAYIAIKLKRTNPKEIPDLKNALPVKSSEVERACLDERTWHQLLTP
jgi:hypothetical protein